MTTSLVPATAADPTPARPSRRRRRWLVIASSVVVVAAAGFGLGFWRYAATYDPGFGSNFSGPYRVAGQPNVHLRETDIGDELYVTGPAGTTAQWITDLTNEGSHDVTIVSFLDSGLITDVRWTPYVVRNGGNVFGVRLPPRPFPATLAPNQTIRLLLTFRKPVCEPGGQVTVDSLYLHWRALGVNHEYAMPLGGGGQPPTVLVGCPTHVR